MKKTPNINNENVEKQLESIGLFNRAWYTDTNKRVLKSFYTLPTIDFKLKDTPFYYNELNDFIANTG